MNIEQVVAALKQERDRLTKAIEALTGLKSGPQRKKKTLSAAARRKISLAQKARWAKVKKH
jgi:hypothetical protein